MRRTCVLRPFPRGYCLTGGLLLAFLLGFGPAYGQPTRTLTGETVRVLDGDTIRVRIGDRTQKVRYIGVDAPELDHPTWGTETGAREATEANRQLVDRQWVRLELDVQEFDRYDRLLAYVYVGNVMINAELVSQGNARVITISPNVRYQHLFSKLERRARLHRLGLWNERAFRLALPPGR